MIVSARRGLVQTSPGASPVTASRASRAAPNAPPCSPDAVRCSGIPNAAAIMLTQPRDCDPPPITSAPVMRVPDAASASRQSRNENATPSITACVSAARPVSCDNPANRPRSAPSLCGVRSPPR